jgi:hypothetical protein
METQIYLDVELDWITHPSHEGTTDEIIPETIELRSVKTWVDNKQVEIIHALTPDQILSLEEEISNKI